MHKRRSSIKAAVSHTAAFLMFGLDRFERAYSSPVSVSLVFENRTARISLIQLQLGGGLSLIHI